MLVLCSHISTLFFRKEASTSIRVTAVKTTFFVETDVPAKNQWDEIDSDDELKGVDRSEDSLHPDPIKPDEGLHISPRMSSSDILFNKYSCIKETMTKWECSFFALEPYATKFYIIEPAMVQTVVIMGGVHGNEKAGFTAAEILKSWPFVNGRVVVFDRVNAVGSAKAQRFIKLAIGGTWKTVDPNRLYPPDPVNEPLTGFGKEIWELMTLLKPNVFLDLHEGWGVYGKLIKKFGQVSHMVGSQKFSKGSSVIASENTKHVGQLMVNRVNRDIEDQDSHFPVLSPPIDGGLAKRLYNTYGTSSYVLETTSQNQPLALRVQQQLMLCATALHFHGFLIDDLGTIHVSCQSKNQCTMNP